MRIFLRRTKKAQRGRHGLNTSCPTNPQEKQLTGVILHFIIGMRFPLGALSPLTVSWAGFRFPFICGTYAWPRLHDATASEREESQTPTLITYDLRSPGFEHQTGSQLRDTSKEHKRPSK